MTSPSLKLVCKIICGVLVFPGFVALSAFVLAIAPASGRTVATRQSPSQLRSLGPDGRVSTIAGEQE